MHFPSFPSPRVFKKSLTKVETLQLFSTTLLSRAEVRVPYQKGDNR